MRKLAPTVKLNNGRLFPVIGLGTWKVPPGEVGLAVKHAIEVGYRHIDCAALYGNEPEIGQALEEKLKDGAVKREDLFITSKVLNRRQQPDQIVPTLKKTLSDLKLQYLDLYLIHTPFAFKEVNGGLEIADIDYIDVWKKLEECEREGLTKSIGVSNFNSKQLTRVLEVAKIKPVTNQVECHPYLDQNKLFEFCKQRDIVITAFSPLANPALTKEGEVPMIQDARFKKLAAKYKRTAPQIVLRFLFQFGVVPIPMAVNKNYIEENFNIFDFELSSEDTAYIRTFNKNYRVCPFVEAKNSKYYPFNEEF